MGGFGSIDWPQPLMAVDQQINGPKGRMFGLNPPSSEAVLESLANTAVASDRQEDADALLSHIRSVGLYQMFLLTKARPYTDNNLQAFAIFEYMNTRQFITRYNLARNQVRTQLGYIQTEFAANNWPIPTATEWWDLILGSSN